MHTIFFFIVSQHAMFIDVILTLPIVISFLNIDVTFSYDHNLACFFSHNNFVISLLKDQQMELEGVLEHHQVHEIIQQEDGTITEVYYYQPIDQYDQYVDQEPSENQQYQSDTIIIEPQDIKTEPPQVDQL